MGVTADWRLQSVVSGLWAGRDVQGGRMQSFYVLAALLGVIACMDVGRSGVYDSPLANDYYVRRFGFMFGGGRSGLRGLQAMQNRVDSFHSYTQPSYYSSFYHRPSPARTEVELSPLLVESKASQLDRQSKMTSFHRFKAVP